MLTIFRFVRLKELMFLGLISLLSAPSLFSQTITVSKGTVGIRENLTKSVGESFTLEGLEVGMYYNLYLNNPDGCIPVLGLVKTGSAEMEQNSGKVSLTPNSSKVEFKIIDLSECGLEEAEIMLSVGCETCRKQASQSEQRMGMTTSPMSAENLIKDVFIGGNCFDVQNVTGSGSFGMFEGGGSSVSFENGIILSTGQISTAPGPNTNTGTSGNGAPLVSGSDSDLATLSTGTIVEHTVLEFDFIPTENKVSFSYSFASEEYCDYVDSLFNDVFGFFISGPGITGTMNLATLPVTGEEVAINSVNHISNSVFFISNSGECGGGNNPDISFDGFTYPLFAGTDVTPCETYHIKLVIGDVGDGVWDSAVFLGGNTFKAGSLGTVQADIPGVSADFQGVTVENCGEGFIIFNRVGSLSGDVEIPLSINPLSTATPGVDYTNLPSLVTIPAGQQSVSVPFSVFQDAITEGIETIIVEVESSCSCNNTGFTINITDFVPVTAVGENFDLCSVSNVILNANPMNGTMPYTYEWSTSETSPSIGVAPTETTIYTVTITDVCGSSATADYEVQVATNVLATMGGVGEICGDFDSAEILINLEGTAPWSLQYMYNGSLVPLITDIQSSPYVLTVTEPGFYNLVSVASGGCPGNVFGQYEILSGELQFASNVVDLSCNANDGSITVTPFSAAGGYFYEWSSSPNGSSFLNNLAAGPYSVTMTDNIGCSAVETFNLVQPEAPIVESVIPSAVDCNNPTGNIDLTVSGGTGNLTITWDQGVGVMEDPTGLAPNTYTATIIDEAGCEITETATITGDLDLPTVAAADVGIISCTVLTAELSGAGSATGSDITYSWMNASGTVVSTDIDYTTSVPGTYTLTVINGVNGCEDSAIATIDSNTDFPIAAIVDPAQLTCNVVNIPLDGSVSSATNGLDYEWFNEAGDAIGTSSSVNVSSAEEYTLIVTDQVNGCTAEQNVSINEDVANPSSDAGADAFLTCNATMATLSGSGSSVSGSFTYSWVNSSDVEVGTTASVDVSAADTYTLIITDTANGCTAESDADVTPDVNLPIVNVDEDGMITCVNDIATITGAGSSTGSNFTYQWFDPAGDLLTTDISTTVNQSGVYLLQITNTTNDCVAENSVLVPEDMDLPLVEAGDNEELTCTETTVTLVGSSLSDVNGGFTYEWFNDGMVSVGNDPELDATIAGDYTLVVTGPNGCEAQDVATVTLDNNLPVADAGNPATLTCENSSFELGGPLTSTSAGLEYSWENEDGDVVSTDINFTTSDEGTFTLIVFDPNNNCETSDEVVVDANVDYPDADAGADSNLDCNQATFLLGGSGTSTGTEFSYQWTNATGDVVSTDPTYEADSDGSYTLLVTNLNNSCDMTDEVIVSSDFAAPNADAGPDVDIDCVNNQVELQANQNQTVTNVTYAWLDETLTEVSTDPNYTATGSGTFTLVVTDVDNGCEAEDIVIVDNISEEVTADAGAPTTLTCLVLDADLGGASTSIEPGLVYSWTNAAGDEVATTPTFNTTVDGVFTLNVFNPANQCEDTDAVTIDSNIDYPAIDAGIDGALDCDDLSFEMGTLNNSTGANINYVWTNDLGTVVSNDQTYTTTAPGVFTFLITNTANDCAVENTITVTQDILDPIADAGPDANFNCVAINMTLQADEAQNAPNSSYLWLDATGTEVSDQPTYYTENEGTYTLQVTNTDNNCIASDEIVVGTDVEYPVAEGGNPSTIDCDNPSQSVGGVTTSTGTNISYVWTNDAGTVVSNDPIFTTTSGGTFNLTVTNDDNFCESTASAIVFESLDDPMVDVGAGGMLNCDVLEILLGGSNTSQGSDFAYSWENGAGTVVSNELVYSTSTPGDYTLYVENITNGCDSEASISIGQDIAPPVAGAGTDQLLTCSISSVQLSGGTSSGGANISYEWYNAGGVLLGNSQNVDVEETGIYNLVVINNDNGCDATDQVEVTPDANLPVANAGAGSTLTCNIFEANLNGGASTTTSGMTTLNWYDPSGTLISSDAQITVTEPGEYVLEVIDGDNGCDATSTVNVGENITPPTVDAGDTQLFTCTTDFLTLIGTANGGGPFDYTWTDATGTVISTDFTAQVIQSGDYQLEVIDQSNGCSSSDMVTVNPDMNLPTAVASDPLVLNCNIDEVTLSSEGSSSGPNISTAWFDASGTFLSSDPMFNVTLPGTYNLIITDISNNCANETSAVVTQNIQDPIADIIPLGASIIDCTTTGAIVLDGSGSSGLGTLSFEWENMDNPSVSIGSGLQLDVLNAGTYLLIIEDVENGCVDEIPYTVSENLDSPDPQTLTPDVLDCVFGSVALNVTDNANTQNLEVEWFTVDGSFDVNSDITALTVNAIEPGEYFVVLTNIDSGCEKTESVTVDSDSEYPTVVAQGFDELDCVTDEVQLTGEGSTTGSMISYEWTGGTIVSGANTLTPTVSQAGIYTLTVLNEENSCKDTDTFELLENVDVPVGLEADVTPPKCHGLSGAVTIASVDGGAGPYMYSINDGASFNSSPLWANLSSGTYDVIVQDAIGCTYTESVAIPNVLPIQTTLDAEIELEIGESQQLFADLINFDEDQIETITWSPATSLSCSDCLEPIATPDFTTVYKLNIITKDGCPAEDDILLRVKTNVDVYIPNAFSPNGDSDNDVFMIYSASKSIEKIDEFIIADRWGEIVHRTADFQPNDPAYGWNGSSKGKTFNPGVFVYYAVVRLVNGKTETFKGEVTLVR